MKTAMVMSLVWIFSAVLPSGAFAAESATHTPMTEPGYVNYLIARKQHQLADLETEREKVKKRSPRRQYSSGIESRMKVLRQEVAELQTYQLSNP